MQSIQPDICSSELVHLGCHRQTLGQLCADTAEAPWCNISPVLLQLVTDGSEPCQTTHVRSAWTDAEWRILFDCRDLNAWATLDQRDDPLYEEETVEVFFDPVGDLQSYFEIEVNPLNAVLDLVFRKSISGYKGDKAWNCDGFHSLVKKRPGGWTVEMAIPFSAVVVGSPKPLEQWRINFARIDRPDGKRGSAERELSSWAPMGRNSFHTPEKFGTMQFLL